MKNDDLKLKDALDYYNVRMSGVEYFESDVVYPHDKMYVKFHGLVPTAIVETWLAVVYDSFFGVKLLNKIDLRVNNKYAIPIFSTIFLNQIYDWFLYNHDGKYHLMSWQRSDWGNDNNK